MVDEEMKNDSNNIQANKTNHLIQLKAVVDGEVIPVEEMGDQVFAQKLIGDGYGIIPHASTVYSPVNGKLVEVAQTKHAYYIELESGLKVLIHIGENTLILNGEGFTTDVEKGSAVKVGERLGTFDLDYIKKQGYETTISVIVLFENKNTLKVNTHGTKEAIAGETIASEIYY